MRPLRVLVIYLVGVFIRGSLTAPQTCPPEPASDCLPGIYQ